MTWFSIDEKINFTLDGLPYGIFAKKHAPADKRVGMALGQYVIDLSVLLKLEYIAVSGLSITALRNPYLNEYIAQGKALTNDVRKQVQSLFSATICPFKKSHIDHIIIPMSEITLHMPLSVGDYTDFYSSIDHATNVGKMFRDPENALLANWRHMPVAYHGRASSIIVSGQNIHRPKGQLLPTGSASPIFGPSERMDFEIEMAFVIGQESRLGHSISTSESEDYIFGLVLFNDWSARDIQKWEYVPLGPFLGKNFASSISPWVVPIEALDPFRVDGPEQRPEVLPYLSYTGKKNYDINLQMELLTEEGEQQIISQTNFKYLYWNMVQQLAHHTVNGCNVRVGDLLASGTISGPEHHSFGSMLELSWAGSRPISLGKNQRSFLEDYDTLIFSGVAQNSAAKVGFGEIRTTLLPSL